MMIHYLLNRSRMSNGDSTKHVFPRKYSYLPSICASISLAAIAFGISNTVLAFSEDLCVAEDGDAERSITNCLSAHFCGIDARDPTRCRANVMFDAAKATVADSEKARSIIHLDSVYFLAQLAGIDPGGAYWIAAYDQVVDVETYRAFGMYGEPVPVDEKGMPTHSVTLNGWARSSARTGGFSYHFVPPYSPDGEPIRQQCVKIIGAESRDETSRDSSICGVYPNLENARQEGFLLHLREWVYEDRQIPCVDGLTNKDADDTYFFGNDCYMTEQSNAFEAPEPYYIRGWIPTFTALDGFPTPFVVDGGAQIAQYTKGADGEPVANAIYADADGLVQILNQGYSESDLTAVLGSRSPEEFIELMRLGIYLHVLQDRISHFECGDSSPLYPPNSSDEFVFRFDMQECTSDMHAWGHFQEVGQPSLPERTRSALRLTLEELESFVAWKGQTWPDDNPSSLAPSDVDEDLMEAALKDLATVLTVEKGCQRLKAMIELMDDYGFEQLPGHSIDGVADMCG